MWRFAARCDRPLPWRGERDPYRVLVSEVMLQQTQASRVAAVYPRFLRRYPTVEALARARPDAVLRAWGDLGYNRRALNLWRAARAVCERGCFPETAEGLRELPGVGPYTARAVASFAFGRDEAVVEANVRRILHRVYGATGDVQPLADRLLPRGRSAAWNQALMDLGALVCLPRNPRCDGCPLRRSCAWRAGERAASPDPRRPARFETTSRYARGRVVAALRGARFGLSPAALGRATALESRRLERTLGALEREGLVHRRGRSIVLGPGPCWMDGEHAGTRS